MRCRKNVSRSNFHIHYICTKIGRTRERTKISCNNEPKINYSVPPTDSIVYRQHQHSNIQNETVKEWRWGIPKVDAQKEKIMSACICRPTLAKKRVSESCHWEQSWIFPYDTRLDRSWQSSMAIQAKDVNRKPKNAISAVQRRKFASATWWKSGAWIDRWGV